MSHWRQSGVEESQLEDFTAKGFLPPKKVAGWRAPPEHEEAHPEPDEVWKLELKHLNPNGVLHIVGFVSLCEAFLGIESYVGLFRVFFYGKISSTKGELSFATPVGGFGLQRRPRHDDVYPEYTPIDTKKGWHGDRFYIKNPARAPFPMFHGEQPVKYASWSWGTPTPEKTLVGAIKEII
ncbi:retrotransposon protein, putative, unclassified [Panicum miliaceum]|uniref:Retrotransposon protein, putative, unclassified n=1 Tax=Panicum miliaceum TaxID=4540 RepID=A0A3L6S2X6_PANMI|nr:retrotransposon protein, putative, unclassified [Panicum miliaceum]